MGRNRTNVLIAMTRMELAEEIAHAVSDLPGLTALTVSGLEATGDIGVVITDGEPIDDTTPHILIGSADGTQSNIRSSFLTDVQAELVAAAALLVAAGYEVRLPYASDEPAGAAAPAFMPDGPLSVREMQVLALLADGASNKVIARALDISVHTAKFHVASLLTKLRARNRTDAISIALREGILFT